MKLQNAPHAEIGQGFAHPFQLTPQEWAILLQSIRVQRLERPLLMPVIKGNAEAAFTDEDVRYLSEKLSRACADATSQEWVAFALMRAREPGLDEITSGAWYAQGDEVHLRLPNYRFAVTLPAIRKMVWDHPTQQLGSAVYEVVPSEHQRLDLQGEARGNPFTNDPVDLAIAYRELIVTPPRSSGTARPTDSRSSPPSSPSIEERLSTLNQLRQKGLITEDEYRTKRQQILDKL